MTNLGNIMVNKWKLNKSKLSCVDSEDDDDNYVQ